MSSLYGFYIAEREGMEIVENECGFATYKVQGAEVYLRDLYVVPSYRTRGVAADLADQVAERAKSKGCTRMIGSVAPQDPNATQNIKVLLAYGMRLQSASPSLILFEREI